ncbi:MAG: restriction endonuclease [Oscillospiraceae bacterium]|nr:restriction endonuclease [Oscillospiraceae bacterium]
MKKLIRSLILFILVMLVVPFLLRIPVARVLQLTGAAEAGGGLEYAYDISVFLTLLLCLLFAGRRRLAAARRRRKEARAARRERDRIRNSYVMNLDPYEYEEYVAEELRSDGFTDVDTTPKSGDFGADVLARDGDRKVCVQCKRYAPGHLVGVKAVQEIYSAKDYYGCDDAYIYTTSDYSPAAVEMANELGVVLVRTEI